MSDKFSIPFGPIPSRRLGKSLGINNIPPKICTYSCPYCQVGDTIRKSMKRQSFYDPEEIDRQVSQKVKELRENKEKIDYLSFVPDGEPTLDINLGREIELLSHLHIPVAVITNGSLLYNKDVQKDLMKADWVSVKIDAVSKKVWKEVNNPHYELNLDEIKNGIVEFSKKFSSFLNTETMLIAGVNDSRDELEKIASFIGKLGKLTAYISIPTRPPAFSWVKPAPEEKINAAFNIYSKKIDSVKLIIGYEGNEFASSGDVRKDILSITAVHPIREEAVKKMLENSNEDWSLIEEMIEKKELIEASFEEHKFFMRALPGRKDRSNE